MHGFRYLIDLRHPQSFVLPAGPRYNAEFFCVSVLPDIEKNLCDGKRKKTLRSVSLYLDNARAHKANGRSKILLEPKPPRLCIRLIILMLHPSISSCLAT
jgi:hypothetical protein